MPGSRWHPSSRGCATARGNRGPGIGPGTGGAGAGLYESVIDASVKSVRKFRLVPRCGQWCRTRSPDLLFKLHGLVDRLPAGESRDKLPAVVRVLGARCGRRGGDENLAEIRLHHLLPTGAQEGQGSVEVEQSVANAPRHYLDLDRGSEWLYRSSARGVVVPDKRNGNGPGSCTQARPERYRTA